MENNEKYNYKQEEPKTIAYDYLFNYFGGDTFNGKIVVSASIQLAIRAYKNGKEVKFTEEPKCGNAHFDENYKISFNKKTLFSIHKDLRVDNLFRLCFGWDKIESEVIGYTLDYLDKLPDEVSESDFRNFLSSHSKDFDISDNKNAQVPSISYM